MTCAALGVPQVIPKVRTFHNLGNKKSSDIQDEVYENYRFHKETEWIHIANGIRDREPRSYRCTSPSLPA